MISNLSMKEKKTPNVFWKTYIGCVEFITIPSADQMK